MSAKNVLLGGSLILVIILIGGLIVTATFMLYGSTDDSVTGLATVQEISEEQASVIENDDVEAEDELEEDEVKVSSSNAKITEEQAKEIAVNKFGGRVTGMDTDREKGRDVWEVEINKNGKEADVLVDMETGEVLKVEWEDEEEDDDDED